VDACACGLAASQQPVAGLTAVRAQTKPAESAMSHLQEREREGVSGDWEEGERSKVERKQKNAPSTARVVAGHRGRSRRGSSQPAHPKHAQQGHTRITRGCAGEDGVRGGHGAGGEARRNRGKKKKERRVQATGRVESGTGGVKAYERSPLSG
jgi:hypothetical protein